VDGIEQQQAMVSYHIELAQWTATKTFTPGSGPASD